MPYVYRVETSKGVGMYRADCCVDISWQMQPCILNEKKTQRMPKPADDLILQEKIVSKNLHIKKGMYGDCAWSKKNYIFGFATKKQLTRWIFKKEWLLELTRLNMKVNRYKVEKESYIRGSTQAMFLRKHAELIETFKPSDFLAKSST